MLPLHLGCDVNQYKIPYIHKLANQSSCWGLTWISESMDKSFPYLTTQTLPRPLDKNHILHLQMA